MKLGASYTSRELQFIKPARTSRGEMNSHKVYYITLRSGERTATAEAAPLPGLSIDPTETIEQKISECCTLLTQGIHPNELDLHEYPSIRFALECALKELEENAGPHVLYQSDFLRGNGIPINGLVWMDNKEEMLAQAINKIESGFTCIKFKVGALDFDEECRMIEAVRKKHNAFKVEIRLDANGAFDASSAAEQLQELSRFDIHSIEQPVRQGQHEAMQELCASSPIPVALDEELIGVDVHAQGRRLVELIKPAYLILKPTLLGGFAAGEQWIRLATAAGMGWWATSALESNIGLNAIAQWTASLAPSIPQGLGTGSLYRNNIDSPLVVKKGFLYYAVNKSWEQIP